MSQRRQIFVMFHFSIFMNREYSMLIKCGFMLFALKILLLYEDNTDE